jgi:predicted ATP-grasp superfamily ATP-dependent carboligase
MRVFVYENMVALGSGLREEFGPAAPSLLAEGTAMAAAVATDFEAAGCRVFGFRDPELRDLPPPLDRFQPFAVNDFVQLAGAVPRDVDYALLIAPESRRGLYMSAVTLDMAGVKFLGPTPEFIGWATNKHQTAETLRKAGVSAPRGVALTKADAWPSDFPWPAVLKPIDGCGSQDVRRIDGPNRDLRRAASSKTWCDEDEPAWRLEEFVSGAAASVAVLRGPEGFYLLPPCAQHLADDGTFAYLGGSCPLEPPLAERARRLAERAVRAMPPCSGYIGIDLVLGPADDGSRDYVIEVNPRLTTSYIGLRALTETNLAGAMIDVVEGREPNLKFRSGRVEFTADGRVSSS